MRWAFTIAFCLALASAAPTKPAVKKPKSTSSPTPKSGARKPPVSTAKTGPASRTRRGKMARSRVPPAPSYQLHPDPERYQQIQQALADRGYFKGQVNGEWNDDSVDALKRFQADQKLTDDGKINSLSLIGLGLGPKHDGSTAAAVPAPVADPQTSPPPPPHAPESSRD